MKLTTKALEFLRESIQARTRLALAVGKHVDSVERWIRENHVMLTTATSLQVIREESGLTDDEILTNEPATA